MAVDAGNPGALVMAPADLVREEGSLDLTDCDLDDVVLVLAAVAAWVKGGRG
jgi:hypothetical protein